jgi:hypothetical protein
MPVELKISWEGDAPGVAEHRLSIAAFAPALDELVRAYRRIASNMMRAATYAERGRLKELANRLDIQVQSISGNNPLQLTSLCTFNVPPDIQASLFPNALAERASQELLSSIADESAGRLRNAGVRRYLLKLPVGLARQTYELNDNGRSLHQPVIIEDLNMAPSTLTALPYLIAFTGSIVGVGFEPGTSEVRIKPDEGEVTLRLLATTELVERALELRGSPVRGLAVRSKDARLLRLSALDTPQFVLTPELREKYLFQRWDGLLKILAQ